MGYYHSRHRRDDERPRPIASRAKDQARIYLISSFLTAMGPHVYTQYIYFIYPREPRFSFNISIEAASVSIVGGSALSGPGVALCALGDDVDPCCRAALQLDGGIRSRLQPDPDGCHPCGGRPG